MNFKTINKFHTYQVSDEGHVKSLQKTVNSFNGKVFCDVLIKEKYPLKEKYIRGYKSVSIVQYDKNMKKIKRHTKQVHRLVLETFNPVDNMESLQVNHINGIKDDNRLENLEWVTPSQNTIHANKMGKGHQMNQHGEKNSMSKLTNEQVMNIIKETNKPNRKSDTYIAKKYNVTRKTINNIRLNLTWKHIDRNIS